jgi:hypothetical protein
MLRLSLALVMLFTACTGSDKRMNAAAAPEAAITGTQGSSTAGGNDSVSRTPAIDPGGGGDGSGGNGGGEGLGMGDDPDPEVRPDPPQGNYELVQSLDPFTAEYRWPDGTGLVGNVSQEDLNGFIQYGVEYFDNKVTPTEMWLDPETEEPTEIVRDEVLVWFDQSVGEQDLRSMFDTNDFDVVFSWFEPGGIHSNSYASFQLNFDRHTYPTVDDALSFLRSLNYTLEATPNFYNQMSLCMAPPLDLLSRPSTYWTNPPYVSGGDRTWLQYSLHAWTFNLNRQNIVEQYVPGTTSTKVAVIDTGVQRDHPDLQGVFTLYGVDAYESNYVYGKNYGWYRETDSNKFHGTKVSGRIAALTNNQVGGSYLGVSSCTPGIKLLPIYTKGPADSYSKAVRALRFHFSIISGGALESNVKVVNISASGAKGKKFAEYEINRDILVQHRFYVASAGNFGTYGKYYPAAMEAVMGVTGMKGTVIQYSNQPPLEVFEQHPETNYYNTALYPVSAFYDFLLYPPTGQPLGSDYSTTTSGQYSQFFGTSSAAPQVAALAARLYEERPLATREQVWNRIVSTLREPRGSIAGIVDYEAALEGW